MLQAKDLPTNATVSPGLIIRLMFLRTSDESKLYENDKSLNYMSPLILSFSKVPSFFSGSSSSCSKISLAAASPF